MTKELENAKAKLNKLNTEKDVLKIDTRVAETRLRLITRKDPKDKKHYMDILGWIIRMNRECLDIYREMDLLKYQIKTLEKIYK